jgi:hypothetical protein
MKRVKVYLTKMRTEIGYIPVLSNFQTVNRPLQIFAAERQVNNCNESIFFIVRRKDADKLQGFGYHILSMVLLPGNKPRLINYHDGCGVQLEQSFL